MGIHGDVDIGSTRVCMGEIIPCIRDARVRQLALCLYNEFCAVSPDDVYNMICNEEWVRLRSLIPPSMPEEWERCDDHRVLGSSLHDLCPMVVQNAWCDGDVSHRWFRGVYNFDDPRRARLASCVGMRIFCWEQSTLACILRALEQYRTHELHVNYACDDWHVSSSIWTQIRNASATTVGHVVSLVVISRVHRSAFTCVVASHEWMQDQDDSMILRHRGSPLVVLRYVRQVFGGVVVVEFEDSDEWWPLFLLENRMVPPSLIPSLFSSSPCVVSLGDARDGAHCRKRTSIDVNQFTDDRHTRAVIRTWNKSYESKYSDALTLTSLARVAYAETLTHKGCVAHRVHSSTSFHGINARSVITDRFGEMYAALSMERVLKDTVTGLYAVYNSDEVCVSAFAVVLYHTYDGRLACCIDSFAVSTTHQGSGVGNMTFHAMLRGICDHASPRGATYVVFAQCVRTGDARQFWYDKLDDSTLARSLLLQALHIDSMRIPVQLQSQCAPRAREYRSSDLE